MRSEPFTLGRWRCYTMMVMEQAQWLVWTLAILMLGLAVAGFIFSPWAGIAALGVDAFLLVMALSFVIMAFGFNSVTVLNIPRHTVTIDVECLVIEIEDGATEKIPKEDIRPYKIYPGGVIVPVEGLRSGWLWLPPAAFASPDDYQVFLKQMYICGDCAPLTTLNQ